MKRGSKYLFLVWSVLLLLLIAGCGIKDKEKVMIKPTEKSTDEMVREPIQEPLQETMQESKIEAEEVVQSDIQKGTELMPLHVEGTQLVDEEGNPVQLKGLSTHGLSWFPQYVNQELFTELATQWNSNVVRLAMYSAEHNGYCTGGDKEKLKQLIRDGVKYAENAGMYVIVDWHVLGEGDPNLYKEEAKLFFDEISKEFADKQHVIYEICNEPNGGVGWSSVKSYALEVIPVIRANDEDAVIIVGTPNWCQYVDMAAADSITEYDNIMYALHFYAATHKENLRNAMVNAVENGLPIIVSEYGICSADGNGGIDAQQAQAWIDLMDEKNISYVAWNLSNKAETSAVFSSTCNKTSGFSKEDLSEGGLWLYHMMTQNNGNDENVSDEDVIKNEENANGNNIMSNGELSYTAVVTGSWESDNQKYEQYTVALQNTSQQEVTNWEIEIEFDKEITLSDGWNGVYTEDGCKLIIGNADYNGMIAPQGEIKDIGFIISFEDEENPK